METHFASPERATPGELYREIHTAGANPVIDALLKTVSGILAILNEHRQILAINDSLLRMLGIDDAKKILGLRPGEAVHCVHSRDMQAGCGTSKYCSTCGAAISIVTSLGLNEPVEKRCILTIDKDGKSQDLCLKVRACPIMLDNMRFVLLFMQDITLNEKRAALERTFFHDISNLVMSIQGASELMEFRDEAGKKDLAGNIKQLTARLSKEVEMQRALTRDESDSYQIERSDITTESVLRDMKIIFTGHPEAANRILSIPEEIPAALFRSDRHLVLRILTNMLVNAFEATPEGGTVKLWTEASNESISFGVWNRRPISEDDARRVFQRYFSTKDGHGRGLGTYAMKLFGETLLNGRVSFTTSVDEGTTFRFTLPLFG